MRKLKYFTVLMLVGLLTLTGCSFGKKLDAEGRLEKALTKLAKADSFTAKVSVEGEIEGVEGKASLLLKVAKDDDNYNLYLSLEAEADELDDDISISAYVLSSKKKIDLYLGDDYDWSHVKISNDDIEDSFGLDVSDYSSGVDEKDIKDAIKDFKKIKEGKTRNGITEIIATIDADDFEAYGLEDDIDIIFLVDKSNNLTGIKFDIPDLDDVDIEVEIKKINETKVKVPSDVKEDAEEIEIEDLLYSLLDMTGLGEDEYDYDDDDDDYDYDSNDYTTDEIFHDILLSASIETCSDGDFVVDFKNYKDELLLYDSYYDIKRIEDGELTLTKDADEYYCKVTVSRPFVIDGKKCEVTDMEYNRGECK